jgi:hypothetical protein
VEPIPNGRGGVTVTERARVGPYTAAKPVTVKLSQMAGQLSPDGPGSLTGSGLPVGSMPVAGSLSPEPEPESWSPNVPGSNHAPPPSPDLTADLSQMKEPLAEQHLYTDSPRFPLDSLGSLRLPQASIVANSLRRPPPPSSQQGLSEDRFPIPSGSPVGPDIFPRPK